MAEHAIDLGQLESHLWEAANILRGPVDAADFKTYLLPLLFFKRISDAFAAEERLMTILQPKGLLEAKYKTAFTP